MSLAIYVVCFDVVFPHTSQSISATGTYEVKIPKTAEDFDLILTDLKSKILANHSGAKDVIFRSFSQINLSEPVNSNIKIFRCLLEKLLLLIKETANTVTFYESEQIIVSELQESIGNCKASLYLIKNLVSAIQTNLCLLDDH